MKAERRHELKENDLAHYIEVTKKYLDENGKTIGFAVIVIAAAVTAVAMTVRSRAAAIEDTWRARGRLQFADAVTGKEDLKTLTTLTSESPDEQFVFRGLVDKGVQALRLSREAPVSPDPELNAMARNAFEELLSRFGDRPLAVGIAHSGLATVAENEFVLDKDMSHRETAEKHLTAIIENSALNGMPFQRIALERRNTLDKVFTEVEFEYTIPEEDATAEGAAFPTDAADPIKIDLSTLPTIQGTPAAEPGQTADSADDPTDDLPPNTDPADPPQD
jgi:hypothetical protein